MSNLGELYGDSDASSSAIGSIGAVFGAIADITSIAAVIDIDEKILAAVGLLDPGPSELDIILTTIQQGFEKLHQQVTEADLVTRLRALDAYRAKAQSALDTLKEALNASPPALQTVAVDEIRVCREAADGLSADSAWLVPFQDPDFFDDQGDHVYTYPAFVPPITGNQPTPTYKSVDAGYGSLPPQSNQDGTVFNYTYALPTWLYVEAAFLAIGTALDKNFLSDYQANFTSDSAFLSGIHDKIVAGIQPLPQVAWDVPGLAQTAVQNPGKGVSAIFAGASITGFRIDYGAFQTFSGASIMGSYEIPLKDVSGVAAFPVQAVGPEAQLVVPPVISRPAIYQKFLIRVKKKEKDLYKAIGLPAVSESAARIGQFGKPALIPANFGDWSMKDLFALTGTASMGALQRFIENTAPQDTPAGLGFRRLLV